SVSWYRILKAGAAVVTADAQHATAAPSACRVNLRKKSPLSHQARLRIVMENCRGRPTACHRTLKSQCAAHHAGAKLNRVFEGNGWIGELIEVRTGPGGDELARRHLVLRAVHTAHGNQLAGAQVAGAEAARSRRATDDYRVMSLAKTHDDHLQVILIRPEPRYLVVDRGSAEQVYGSTGPLLEGIVDRLQAHP